MHHTGAIQLHACVYLRKTLQYTARYNIDAPQGSQALRNQQHVLGGLEHPAKSIGGTQLA